MNKKTIQYLQSIIAFGMACYFIEKMVSGKLAYYINLRFSGLIIVGIAALLIMACIGFYDLFSSWKLLADGGEYQSNSANAWVFFPAIFLLPAGLILSGVSSLITWVVFLLCTLIGWARLVSIIQRESVHHLLATDVPAAALIILVIPLILGIVVPANPLSTASLISRGMNLSAPLSIDQKSARPVDIAPDDRNILDWIKIINYSEDPSAYKGTTANVIGFVYHDPRLDKQKFMVGRFIITCCVADGFAIGMAADWPEGIYFEDDTWVAVKGEIDTIEIEGEKVPFIHAQSVIKVEAPAQPYLYP